MKTARFYLIWSSILVAMLTSVQPAPAQFTDSMGGGWNNPLSASASTMIWNSIFYRVHTNSSASKGRTSSSAPRQQAQPSKRIDLSVVRFRPVGTYIKTRELADKLGSSPEEREQYRKLMNVVLQAFDQQAQKEGLQNDLALALSYYFGENARIYHGQAEPSDQQFLNLRNLIATALAEGGALNNVSDRQKQEMYEGLVAYTGITQFGYEQAMKAGNEQIARGYQKVAGQNLQGITHLSPDSITFTAEGMRISNAPR